MALVAKNEFKAELAPEGTQLAVCVWVIDLGWQHEKTAEWEKDLPKILFGWELPDCIIPDSDKPFMANRTFTLTMSDRGNLKPFMESWRGEAYSQEQIDAGVDVRRVLGSWGLISIVHTEDKKYANVSNIVGLPASMKGTVAKRKPLNELLSLDMDKFDQDTFNKLPRWVQEKIMKSQEYQKMTGTWKPTDEDIDEIDEDEFTGGGGPNRDDDIPFSPSKI